MSMISSARLLIFAALFGFWSSWRLLPIRFFGSSYVEGLKDSAIDFASTSAFGIIVSLTSLDSSDSSI
jgi:hypothetical protein